MLGSQRGIFNQRTPSLWNEGDPSQSLVDATGGSSAASDKANRLALMYRRPFEIMNHATLDEVSLGSRRDEVM
jgi:UBX domain-containing protein 7